MQIIKAQICAFWCKAPNLRHYNFPDLVSLGAIPLLEASSVVGRWILFKIRTFWDRLYLIKSLNAAEREWSQGERQHGQKAIEHLTGQSGTKEEIAKWYQQNKDKLVFDPEEKMYKVKQ